MQLNLFDGDGLSDYSRADYLRRDLLVRYLAFISLGYPPESIPVQNWRNNNKKS